MTVKSIFGAIEAGDRISREQGLFLLQNADLLDLGDCANSIRFKRNPNPWVTFVVDTNPNYTNVCNIDCIF